MIYKASWKISNLHKWTHRYNKEVIMSKIVTTLQMKTIISFKVSSIKTFSDQAPNIICIWAASCKKAKYYKARAKPVFKFTPKKSMVKNICWIK